MTDEMELEGYCLKCQEKRIIQDAKPEWAANGTPATRGKCSVCGTNIYKRGHTPAHDNLPKPEIIPAKRRSTKKKGKGRRKSNKTKRRSGKLVVVESPAKARTIGRYLGRGYKVMSSVGHVRDLLRSRLSVDVENGYTPEYRVPNDKRKVVKELKQAAESAKEIYLATDLDREGEAIAWHVCESAEMEIDRTHRVVFQEITKPAIIAAFEEPREIDMDRVNAQQARRILDRLVGYKLSPLLWRKVRGRLSAGRVQSVAVRLVVERERAIDSFVPEEYWTLEAELSQQKHRDLTPRPGFSAKLHKLNGQDPSLHSEEDIAPHLAQLETAEWTVNRVRIGTRRRSPAAPFTTSTLQQEASRKINFGTSKTMRIAQQLYEGVDIGTEGTVGLITYMRTDSVSISKEAQLEARDLILQRFGPEFAPKNPPTYKTKSKAAQEAHEAIRPTSAGRTPETMKSFLSRDQLRLYRLIWQRFVASQMSRAVYDTVSVDIMAGESETVPSKRPYLFRASGSTLRFAGFLALYEESKPKDRPENGKNPIPADLQKNEALDMLRLLPEQHFTQPPPRFSEASLVKELEENGIGRPSTYASIITTIIARGYVEREEKRLRPTEIGQLVNDLLVEYFPDVMSVDFTARLEEELDEIVNGKPWVPVVDDFYQPFAQRLEVADEAIEKISIQTEPEFVGRDCPVCGNPLLYREGRYGRFIGCSNFPKCRHTEQILNKIGVICPKDGGDVVEKQTRKRKKFYGCSNYPDCDFVSWKRPIATPCRVCGSLLIQVNKDTAECTQCGERQTIQAEENIKETASI
jgi:DNA topoisomerase-1